jgi:hypothetical protein
MTTSTLEEIMLNVDGRVSAVEDWKARLGEGSVTVADFFWSVDVISKVIDRTTYQSYSRLR